MAESISNYTELKASIIDWLERDDLTDYVDYFIDLAEERFKRDLRFREIQEREELSVPYTGTDADRYVALSGLSKTFNDIKSIRLQTPGGLTTGPKYTRPLKYVPVTEMAPLSMLDAYRPTHYTTWEQVLEFNTPPDQAYTAEVFYYFEMDPLDSTNTSNELLARAPDIYLYGALAQTATFLHEDERVTVWETLVTTMIDSLNRTESEHNRPGPIVARADGPPKQVTRYRWR